MLRIEKENSSFLRLETSDEAVIRHIRDEFTFEVPNFKFTKAFKAGRSWNGKINLLQKNKFLYSGLINVLEDFLKENDYSYINNFNINKENVSLDDLKNHISYLSLPFEVRDYQLSSVLNVLNQKNVICIIPTSGGKTATLFIILSFIIKHKLAKKFLLLVPTVSLIHQMKKDFISYCSFDKIRNFFEENIHCILDGGEKFTMKPLTISCWQSAIHLDKEYLSSFDVVVADEVHLMSKASGQSILEQSINTSYRIGLTGTLQEVALDLLVLEGLFGKPFQYVSTKELMNRGQVANLRIKNIILNYSDPLKKMISSLTYQEEYDLIISIPSRMNILSDFVSSLKKNTLVLFTRIEKHGDILFEELKKKNPDKMVFYISGKNKAEEREEVRIITEANNNVIIVASFGTFAQGVSINNIHNVVFSSPYKSRIKILQSIGRGLRLHSEKDFCTIYDFVDNAKFKNKQNYFLSHFLSRYELYQKEGFDVENINHPQEII